MAKKKKINPSSDVEELLTFELPKTGVKKNPDNVKNIKAPSFYVSDEPIINNRDRFKDVKKAIYDLAQGKCLIVCNNETGLTVFELQKKITNILFGHKRKFVEKEFSTSKIDNNCLGVWRNK